MKKKRIEYAVEFKYRGLNGTITGWISPHYGFKSKKQAWSFFTFGFLSVEARIKQRVCGVDGIQQTRMIRRTIIEEVVR